MLNTERIESRYSIAIVGSRGIPAKYGGNEVFVEEISRRLRGLFKIYVTCESYRFFEDAYEGIIRVHISSIKGKSITIPSINDIISTIYLLLLHPDVNVVYYVAPDGALATILAKLAKKKVIINTDGIEWYRPIKRSLFVPFYLRFAYLVTAIYLCIMEYLSCKLPDITVADSINIKKRLEQKYNAKHVIYIPYGARVLISSFSVSDIEREIKTLERFELKPDEYYLVVARIVAENNIHTIIAGYSIANSTKKLVIVGNFNRNDSYVKCLVKMRGKNENVVFIDPIYDKEVLGILRKNCFAYVHAYEVGGTNPSLLEQMLFEKPILAYDVPFNREVLQDGGIYFKDANNLGSKIRLLENGRINLTSMKEIMRERINRQYSWEKVGEDYEKLFRSLLKLV